MRFESDLGSCSGELSRELRARAGSRSLSALPHLVFLLAVASSEISEELVEFAGDALDLREGAGWGGGGRRPAAEPLQKSRMRASWYWSIARAAAWSSAEATVEVDAWREGASRPWARDFLLEVENMLMTIRSDGDDGDSESKRCSGHGRGELGGTWSRCVEH